MTTNGNKRWHVIHFLILFVIIGGGIAAFLQVGPDTGTQMVIGLLTTIAYVAWGIIHHAMQGDLHRSIVVEYALIGLIALIVLFTVVGS